MVVGRSVAGGGGRFVIELGFSRSSTVGVGGSSRVRCLSVVGGFTCTARTICMGNRNIIIVEYYYLSKVP